MKRLQQLTVLLLAISAFGCKKTIDLYPESNLNAGTYYSNTEEVMAGLTGAYNGMQRPLNIEWQFTELRSDNTKMGAPGSTASNNRDLSDLDMFIPSTSHAANYQYWLMTYNNIRNANIILERLGVTYNEGTGALSFNAINIPISEADRRQFAGEALFIRAYHYFNLVRLYGGVFLVHRSITPAEAKQMNRVSEADIYKLIEADLKLAATSMSQLKFTQMPAANLGRATTWAAKGLLAKVYLTLNRKAEAIPLLQDVITNSGHSLQGSYASVFATNNEMNSEIIFAVRYKVGGLGSRFANDFAPLGSGSLVINGDGDGLNYPTAQLDTLTNGGDLRKATLIARFGTGTAEKLYVRKFFSAVTIPDDAENDWPVLRYADILMMMAEAQGFVPSSIDYINSVRPRAGLTPYTTADLNTVAKFEQALSKERRIEFAFENQRWFDLLRFNVTLTTITSESEMKAHFLDEYAKHYATYVAPAPTLAELYAQTNRPRMLLPIPQREIDTNTQLQIPQNPSY